MGIKLYIVANQFLHVMPALSSSTRSAFLDLDRRLRRGGALPRGVMPGKHMFGNNDPKVLEARRAKLQLYDFLSVYVQYLSIAYSVYFQYLSRAKSVQISRLLVRRVMCDSEIARKF